jgi:DNA-binding NarL/FixJ family response regulator
MSSVSPARLPGVVLVLDPDEVVLTACGKMLGKAGMIVRVAATLEQALVHVAGGGIEVVLASVRVPDAEAAAVLHAIRARDPHLPVVFVETWPDFGGAATPEDSESLRATVAAAAVGYRLGRRARSASSLHPIGVIEPRRSPPT